MILAPNESEFWKFPRFHIPNVIHVCVCVLWELPSWPFFSNQVSSIPQQTKTSWTEISHVSIVSMIFHYLPLYHIVFMLYPYLISILHPLSFGKTRKCPSSTQFAASSLSPVSTMPRERTPRRPLTIRSTAWPTISWPLGTRRKRMFWCGVEAKKHWKHVETMHVLGWEVDGSWEVKHHGKLGKGLDNGWGRWFCLSHKNTETFFR